MQDLYGEKFRIVLGLLEKTKIYRKLFHTHRFSVIKMLILLEFIYRFKAIYIRNPAGFLHKFDKLILKFI